MRHFTQIDIAQAQRALAMGLPVDPEVAAVCMEDAQHDSLDEVEEAERELSNCKAGMHDAASSIEDAFSDLEDLESLIEKGMPVPAADWKRIYDSLKDALSELR